MDTQRIGRMTRMLAASEATRHSRAEGGVVTESALAPDAAPERPSDILDLVDGNLTRPDNVDPADWNKARELLLAFGQSALKKVSAGDRGLDRDEAVAMEAVIISDGTRPGFLLADGKVKSNDPFLGSWGPSVATAEANGIGTLAKAVGRIQPGNGHASNYIGTGSLIDRDAGLLLTNFHVIQQAANRFGVAMTRDGDRIRIDGVLEIDFIAEVDSLATNKHRIVEVLLPQGVGEVFAGNDVVVARLDLAGHAALPAAVPILSARASYANGGLTSLSVIGFPAEPQVTGGTDVDWNFVIRTLFANTFGFKRLAPGLFSERLGSHPDDAVAKRALGHDATTFGGASGALVAAWLDSDTPCFAIHFGGATGKNNYALSFAVANGVLQPLGVKF